MKKSKLDTLRERLGTKSLRQWLRKEFPHRTQALLEALPTLVEHAYTTPTTYTVRIVDKETGEYLEEQWTEEALRVQFGDAVFEDAYAQLDYGDSYVDLDDYDLPFGGWKWDDEPN